LKNEKIQKIPLKIQKGVVNMENKYYIIDDYDEEIKSNIYYNELMKQAKEIHNKKTQNKDIDNIDYNISILRELIDKYYNYKSSDIKPVKVGRVEPKKSNIARKKRDKSNLIYKMLKQVKQIIR
jgi:hypothetical protein